MEKRVYRAVESDVFAAPEGDANCVEVRIPGLAAVGPADECRFRLYGTKQRDVDPDALRSAFGGDLSDDCVDALCNVVFKHDLVRVLTERICGEG